MKQKQPKVKISALELYLQVPSTNEVVNRIGTRSEGEASRLIPNYTKTVHTIPLRITTPMSLVQYLWLIPRLDKGQEVI